MEGEGNCSKNGTGEKEHKSIGKYRFFESMEDGHKHINLRSFVITHFIGKNWYKICQCKKLNQ